MGNISKIFAKSTRCIMKKKDSVRVPSIQMDIGNDIVAFSRLVQSQPFSLLYFIREINMVYYEENEG